MTTSDSLSSVSPWAIAKGLDFLWVTVCRATAISYISWRTFLVRFAQVLQTTWYRVYEHKNKIIPGFTSRYNISQLVYFEETSDVQTALAREKEIKGWRRAKKTRLVDSTNPKWLDLSSAWFKDEIPRFARNDS